MSQSDESNDAATAAALGRANSTIRSTSGQIKRLASQLEAANARLALLNNTGTTTAATDENLRKVESNKNLNLRQAKVTDTNMLSRDHRDTDHLHQSNYNLAAGPGVNVLFVSVLAAIMISAMVSAITVKAFF